MIIKYSGRGILVPIYVTISVVVIAILNILLKEYVGGIFLLKYDFQIVLGIGVFLSGLWIHFTSKDYINVNGKKEEIYLNNSFFFLSLKTWRYILTYGGILALISGIFETLEKLK